MTTTYQVTIGERTVRVTLRREGDQYVARLDDGPEQLVALRTVHGPLRALELGSRRAELLAEHSEGGVTLAIGGVEYRAEVVDELHARLASVTSTRGSGHLRRELKAPMPGLLVNILCAVGDEIEPGQPLAVLRAMKMENELSLTRGGKVTAVNVGPGQTVEQGEVLLVVE
jgi:biotin carboxyl carrier protein